MAVHNENYKEVLELLGNMYVKYIDIDNSITSKAPFIKKIYKDISKEEIVDFPIINGEKKTLYGQRLNAEQTAVETNASYNINNDSFTDLINQALYTKINIMEVNQDKDNIDNLGKTKGYLKFAKGSTTTPKTKVRISSDEDNIFNLICGMNLVNVFIDILEAYENFLDNTNNIRHFKKNVNNIIIVNKHARDSASNDVNYGYWVDGDNGVNKMSESTLFLSIDSYDTGDSSANSATATNKLFQELRVKYNGYGRNVVGSSLQSDEITSGVLFSNGRIRNQEQTADIDTLSGIIIKILPDGRSVIKQPPTREDIYLDDTNNSPIEANKIEEALIIRDKRLLQDFLNAIIKLNLVTRKTQISGLLKFFKVIKQYFYIAITTGNLLYNSIHNKTTLDGRACAGGADVAPSTCDYTLHATTTLNCTGYGIKYLPKADILKQSTYIYNDSTRRTVVASAIKLTPSPGVVAGSDGSNSMFGLAHTENDTFIANIISDVTNLHMKSATAANIAKSDEFAISKTGFIAEVLTDRSMRIKSRINLFNKLKIANDQKRTDDDSKVELTTPIYSGNFYVKGGTHDALILYNDLEGKISGDTSFKESSIIESDLPIAVKNKLIDKKMGIAATHMISINNSSYPIEGIETGDNGDFEFIISARLLYPSQNDEALKDVPVLALPYQYVTLFSSGGAPLPDTATSDNYFGRFDKGSYVYFHAEGDGTGFGNKVLITIKKPLDYKTGYINNVDAINNINNQINSNQSKIKNIKTLYDLNKSKNNVLYYQLVAYIIFLIGIIITLGLTYAMKMEKPIIKLVSSVCFGIVVLKVVTYYILGVLYIEKFTTSNIVEKFSDVNLMVIPQDGNSTTEFTADGNNDYPSKKITYVNNQLLLLNSKIIKAVELANVSVGQADSTSAYTTLLGNTSSERARRARVNSILSRESDGSLMHIDLLKYSSSVYGVYIKTVLMFGLAITALFTINLYTDNKYMENIAFIGTFVLVVIFSYYLIYSNAIVRTKSNNVYWGKEYKSQYTDLK
jgi:hypothetical protein